MEVRTAMQNTKINSKMLIIGLIVFVAAMFLIPRIFGSDNDNDANNNDDNGGQEVVDRQEIDLGEVVTTSNVDRDGCPVDETSTFNASDQIWVAARESSFPQGTLVFVRLYREGQAVEDSLEVEADQDYSNACFSVVFEPTAGASFEPGNYEAEFYINGNRADSVEFEVG
jgi:hypothetical protein